ncbi:MAG TPA: DUF4159 domain-containing protein [Prolixibacteraceae bacterium]|nr:DUF4159 domain-containing protein [Prolixibacteraceae bacterium]HNZ68320.1 DUF4159 domain-containing protein [Prolixibacteraceae bacterium]HOC87505.1 DUF4159 domain-containing protein [Prolixibacteraceae bacterium]HOG95297.1 DUF4159 domain-containing protein [Prolixibacteraceae bacterium]HOR99513.1 DUF4159 domain-containing protein [Prolixibacteraceae bacterium]
MYRMTNRILFLLTILLSLAASGQNTSVKIALLKYGGGGDWYGDPTALTNLIAFCNRELGSGIYPEYATVETGSSEIFNYPFVHLTGHGNVVFSDSDARNLRLYLEAGGFLHIDDNYGMDPYIRREMKKVFPEKEFVELPPSHPLFSKKFPFPEGLPKIHEHDNKPPQAFGIFVGNRLVCLYTYESDLSDGWEDIEVHKDPEEIRQKALMMGANIIAFVFGQ